MGKIDDFSTSLKDFSTALKEMPGPAYAALAVIAIASIAAYELDGVDDIDLEAQLSGTMESLKVCKIELKDKSEDLAKTKSKLFDSDLWMREFRVKFLDERGKAYSLETQIKELQKKHQERLQRLAEAEKVSRAEAAPVSKKPAKSKLRARRTPPKDWWITVWEAMS